MRTRNIGRGAWVGVILGCAIILGGGIARAATYFLYDSNGNRVAAIDGSALTQNQVPAGVLLPFAGSVAPAGYLLCNGAAVSRTSYAALFAVIGTTYGPGDGTTTFNLPDLRGRGPLGAGQGPGLTNRAPGATGGEETHVLSTAEMPTHTHLQDPHNHILQYYPWSRAAGSSGVYALADTSTYPNPNYIGSTSATNRNAGQSSAHNTMPPFVVVNFIVKS